MTSCSTEWKSLHTRQSQSHDLKWENALIIRVRFSLIFQLILVSFEWGLKQIHLRKSMKT